MTNSNLSRRTLAAGVAWTVPAVAAATAAPAFAASPDPVYPGINGWVLGGCDYLGAFTLTGYGRGQGRQLGLYVADTLEGHKLRDIRMRLQIRADRRAPVFSGQADCWTKPQLVETRGRGADRVHIYETSYTCYDGQDADGQFVTARAGRTDLNTDNFRFWADFGRDCPSGERWGMYRHVIIDDGTTKEMKQFCRGVCYDDQNPIGQYDNPIGGNRAGARSFGASSDGATAEAEGETIL